MSVQWKTNPAPFVESPLRHQPMHQLLILCYKSTLKSDKMVPSTGAGPFQSGGRVSDRRAGRGVVASRFESVLSPCEQLGAMEIYDELDVITRAECRIIARRLGPPVIGDPSPHANVSYSYAAALYLRSRRRTAGYVYGGRRIKGQS